MSAPTDAERGEWIFILQKLIPGSSYDECDPLQAASLEMDVEVIDTEFYSDSSPGIMIERRGNWAIASVVSENLSTKVCQGSVLLKVQGERVLASGFDSVVSKLGYWQAPLRLSFLLSPKKMGWVGYANERSKSWLNMFGLRSKTWSTNEVVWGELSVYANIGHLLLF